MAQRPMTNTEFVTHLMERSRFGAMSQMVILTAIEHYAERCVEIGPGCLGQAGNMISEKTWLETCQELKTAIATRLHASDTNYLTHDKVRTEDLDTDLLEGDDFFVCLQNDHLQELRNAALLGIATLDRCNPKHTNTSDAVAASVALKHGLTVTGGAYVNELVRD